MERPVFASVREYGAYYTDPAYWRSYVAEVCTRHGLTGTGKIRSGLAGSHPTFLVDNQWVVKFFSDMFGGQHSCAVEREIFALFVQQPCFPVARLVAEGSLFTDGTEWRWPYLVTTILPGTSLGEVYPEIGDQERSGIVQILGEWLLKLHYIRLDSTGILTPDWTPFYDWLTVQRAHCVANHRRWQSLPTRLIDQIDDYLLEVDELVDRSKQPLLLHCDMNADHLLGELRAGHWTSSGIIDFGDAKVGDFHYELGALHFGLFRCDSRLLRLFLRSYGSDVDLQSDFARRAMSYTLLHECNVLECVQEYVRNIDQITTMAELANTIW